MGFLGKYFRKKTVDVDFEKGPFKAQIIFECDLVPQNQEKVRAAVEEFMEKYQKNIAENPRVTQASDGNVVEITLLCKNKDELLFLNKELEAIALRYGLR